MTDEKIREVLKKRISLQSEDDFNLKKCWKEETSILCENIEETIDFLYNRCTGEEFSWISEVFDDVAEESQSTEFIACLYDVAKKYPEETKEYNLIYFIDTAKELIE